MLLQEELLGEGRDGVGLSGPEVGWPGDATALVEASPTRARAREADSMKIPSLPNATQFRAWILAVRNEIAAASGRGEAAFKWALEVEEVEATFEGLANSGDFEILDVKLGSALSKISQW